METQNILIKQRSATEIQEWIISYLANLLEIDPDEIEVTVPFDRYGLNSLAAVGLTGELEDWLGKKIDPILLYEYPNIESLVEYLISDIDTFELLES